MSQREPPSNLPQDFQKLTKDQHRKVVEWLSTREHSSYEGIHPYSLDCRSQQTLPRDTGEFTIPSRGDDQKSEKCPQRGYCCGANHLPRFNLTLADGTQLQGVLIQGSGGYVKSEADMHKYIRQLREGKTLRIYEPRPGYVSVRREDGGEPFSVPLIGAKAVALTCCGGSAC